MKLFLSYASPDKRVAEEIRLALLGAGHQVFFDEASLPLGGDYNSRIREAIFDSDVFIFLISPNSISPGRYVQTELQLAKTKWPKPWGVVLPVMIAPTEHKLIDPYLTAVTILEPHGSAPAEVAAAVLSLRTSPGPSKLKPRIRKLLRKIYDRKIVVFIALAVVIVAGSALWFLPHTRRSWIKPVEPQVTKTPGETMVQIPRGSFRMGSTNGELDEGPVHEVYVDGFYMDKYEVTVVEFRKFIDATSYVTEVEKAGFSYEWTGQKWEKMLSVNWRRDAKGNQIKAGSEGSNHPVVHISWNDAVAYAEWAGKRLPTEAEWEYAARGGNTGMGEFPIYEYPWGNDIDRTRANYHNLMTSPVGSFSQNGFGLYDMAGNVWEWCADWYDPKYYATAPKVDPKGPDSGKRRVMRGGSWLVDPDLLRCALRGRLHFVPWSNDTGFRCVLDM